MKNSAHPPSKRDASHAAFDIYSTKGFSKIPDRTLKLFSILETYMCSPTPSFYEFGPFRLDVMRALLLRKGEHVPLSPKAFETLLTLVRNRGRVMKKEELIERIWPDSFVEEGNLTQNIFVLRKALGEGPNDHRYIVTVPGQGYRFVAPVRGLSEETAETAGEARGLAPQTFEGVETVASIAVLPFKTLGGEEASDRFLGPGLADALITRLSSITKITVRSTTAVLKYTDPEQNPFDAGRELGVETVLSGYVQRSGERIRVTVQLVRLRDGKTLWAEKFDEKFTDVFTVQDSISEQVAGALTLKLTAEEQRLLTKRYTENSEAFQAFIKGRYFWNKRTTEGLRKAIEYAQQAIAIDPAYALAYVGLADSYNLLPGHSGLSPRDAFPKAKAAAMRALEIDDTLAEAYASLGFVNYRFDWDWAASERNFLRAVELKPNYPTAHHWYGESLAATGRLEESIATLERALELDPLSLPVNTDLGQSLYFARRYEEASEQLRRALEMDSNFIRALIILGMVYDQQGRFDGATALMQKAVELSARNPLALSGLAYTHASAGKALEARLILEELQQLSRQRYVSPYNLAVVHAGLRETSAALDFLEKAVEQRDVWLVWLKVNPRFDPLRADSRFEELMRRVGLIS
ncbi:MAG TPA: winged helix-turn-helix domain-containing protein [Pyrinomonadaceae bacterium]|jgi:TolB-like protein/tetratricopeptide (TPR) repeat protein